MAKWFFENKHREDNPGDENAPEIARFHERCYSYADLALPNPVGVMIVATLTESDDRESCDWCVWDNGEIIAKGVEFSTETLWAIDIAQRKAEKAITTKRVPLVVGRPARPERREVITEEQRINRVVSDWNGHRTRRQVA